MSTYEVEHSIPPTPQQTRNNSTHPSSTTSSSPSSHRAAHHPISRPDLSTFFTTLAQIEPAGGGRRTRPHAHPLPAEVAAAHRTLAEALALLRAETEVGGVGDAVAGLGLDGGVGAGGAGGAGIIGVGGEGSGSAETGTGERDLLGRMIAALVAGAEEPPVEVKGVSEEFCDGLERVSPPAKDPTAACPICTVPFATHDMDDGDITSTSTTTPSSSSSATTTPTAKQPPKAGTPRPLLVRLPCPGRHVFGLDCVRPWLRLRGTCPLDRTDFGAQERQREAERAARLRRRFVGGGDDGEGTKGKGKSEVEEEEEEEWDGMYG